MWLLLWLLLPILLWMVMVCSKPSVHSGPSVRRVHCPYSWHLFSVSHARGSQRSCTCVRTSHQGSVPDRLRPTSLFTLLKTSYFQLCQTLAIFCHMSTKQVSLQQTHQVGPLLTSIRCVPGSSTSPNCLLCFKNSTHLYCSVHVLWGSPCP